MISRIVCTICLITVMSLTAMSQDVPKVEVFAGVSWAGGNFKGPNTSATVNINKWLGLTADYSGHYGSERPGVVLISQNAQTFQAGPRVALRGKRLTPFFYALFGGTRFKQSATINGQYLSESDSGFASTYGGGLDVKVTGRVSIRAFQIDYFRPNFFGEAHNRGRLSAGVVFKFGRR